MPTLFQTKNTNDRHARYLANTEVDMEITALVVDKLN